MLSHCRVRTHMCVHVYFSSPLNTARPILWPNHCNFCNYHASLLCDTCMRVSAVCLALLFFLASPASLLYHSFWPTTKPTGSVRETAKKREREKTHAVERPHGREQHTQTKKKEGTRIPFGDIPQAATLLASYSNELYTAHFSRHAHEARDPYP